MWNYIELYIFLVLDNCICKDLIDPSGVGNCQGPQSHLHDARVVCYVKDPGMSKCRHLETCSPLLAGEKCSSDACEKTGILIYMPTCITT